MRRVCLVAGIIAMLNLAAAAAHAWQDGIDLDNIDNTSTNPHATTNGLFWIDTGSGPALLNNDINAEFFCGTLPSSMQLMTNLNYNGVPTQNGPQYSIFLLSNSTGAGDITFFGNGDFIDPYGVEWVTLNDPNGEGTPASFQIQAWTGNTYNDYQDAYIASARGTAGIYVAQSPIFTNHVALGSFPIEPPTDLTNMPAVILTRGLMGDANIDGRVDINDLTIVLANYGGTNGVTWAMGDFNGDGRVDINDLTIVLANYGATIEAPVVRGGMAAVPEPGVFALLAAALAGIAGAVRIEETRIVATGRKRKENVL